MKLILTIVSFLSILCLASSPACATGAKKPNIIYILADDMGYADLTAQHPDLTKALLSRFD